VSTGNDGTGGRRVFDAHLHVVDPRFPLVPNDGYLPPEFTVSDYTRRAPGLGVVGNAAEFYRVAEPLAAARTSC
jgi:predicted TIM-barrel fold metal-dependent hydrolase